MIPCIDYGFFFVCWTKIKIFIFKVYNTKWYVKLLVWYLCLPTTLFSIEDQLKPTLTVQKNLIFVFTNNNKINQMGREKTRVLCVEGKRGTMFTSWVPYSINLLPIEPAQKSWYNLGAEHMFRYSGRNRGIHGVHDFKWFWFLEHTYCLEKWFWFQNDFK